MTFDEFGQIIASRENGPLLVIRDDDKDGLVDTVSTYCDEMKNCQGLLAVSGKMFADRRRPAGPGLVSADATTTRTARSTRSKRS